MIRPDFGYKLSDPDTSGERSLSKNADKLGVYLWTADAAGLSHHYYDHSGGLSRFFELNSNVKVYLRRPPDGDCYFKAFLFRKRYIGLDKDLFKAYSARFAFIKEFTEILPDVYIFMNIGSTYPKLKGTILRGQKFEFTTR